MKHNIKTIIVDDEMLPREDLIEILKRFSAIKVVGEASNLEEARELIKIDKPDLIFLDIKLRGENGFELLPDIPKDVKIVFVTAYDTFAVKAFEVNAQDYIMKPVNPDRLAQTIDRIIKGESNNAKKEIGSLNYDDSIFIQLNGRYSFLKIDSILVIQSAGDYSEIIKSDKSKYLCNKSMKEWEERLPNNYFGRIHRGTIVNVRKIERIEEWFNHTFRIHISGLKDTFQMSRGYAIKVRELFG